MRIGYLECFSGISGDMLLGALVDAGVPFACLEETAVALGVGARLEMRKVSRGGLAATKVDVIALDTQRVETTHTHDDHPEHTHHGHESVEHHHHAHTHASHRSLSAILAIIRSARLTVSVKQRAIRAFQLLGEAEAAIHSVPVEEVHFHEVGAVDTIIDIVCAAAGAEWLGLTPGVARWFSSPLNVGSGTVVCQHGTLPVPAPATLALLMDAPVYAAGEPMERVTPTGAVLLRMLDVQYAPLPQMRVLQTGYGAGGRETHGQPNLLRLLVGEETSDDPTESIAVIETVIDDATPQLLAYVSEKLLEAGAWDVYRASVQMKKGRCGVQMTVLCRPDLVPTLQELLFRETTTIGLRWRMENKAALAREFVAVDTRWGKVSIKIARLPNGVIANAAPEYEDCRKIATEHSVPLKQVMEEAIQAYAATKENR
jgi:uncharacterized protein (TIGR00299 family) protein